MKIVIKGDVREIAALAVDIQEQKKECVIPELAPGMAVVTSGGNRKEIDELIVNLSEHIMALIKNGDNTGNGITEKTKALAAIVQTRAFMD